MKRWFYVSILSLACTACEDNTLERSKTAIEKIQAYAKDFKHHSVPTLKDYHDAGVADITTSTVQKTNAHIVEISEKYGDGTYRYDPNQNYVYDFNQTSCKSFTLSLEDNTIDIENIPPVKTESLFLKLLISHMPMGTYFMPKIILSYKNKVYHHEFEMGAYGTRYLNLSNLPLSSHSKITINTKYLTLPNQKVELIRCKKPQLEGKTILVMAPHPDDAEIAAYGLYSRYAKNVYVVTVTAGEQGGDAYGSIYPNRVKQYLEKGKFRTWNSLVVPLLGGVNIEHCVNLGFFDYTLASMFRHKEGIAQGTFTHVSDIEQFRKQNISSLSKGLIGVANWKSLVDNYIYLLKKIKPDIIVTPYPAIDKHPDHQYTSIALFEALQKAKVKKGKLFMYTNHSIYGEYYPYGKRSSDIDLPPLFKNSIFYFNNIYSFPVSPTVQKEKILVLDAMNDLRPGIDWYFDKKDCCQLKKYIYDKNGNDISYFRRAIRANELFFVVDINNIYDKNIMSKLLPH